jgi:hypothetical protein
MLYAHLAGQLRRGRLMQFGRSQFLLAILAIAIVCASPTSAFADPPAPTITVKVNNQPVTLSGDAPAYDTGSDSWSSTFLAGASGFGIDGSAGFSNNAFVFYALDAINFSAEDLSFVVVFSIPLTGGPYDLLRSQHLSTIRDGDGQGGPLNGVASVQLGNGSLFVHSAQIDGVDVPDSGISKGCEVHGSNGFVSDCQQSLSLDVPTAAQSGATLGVTLSFILSARDRFSPSGSVDLVPTTTIPEPRTDLLLFAGMAMVIGVIARRRVH